MLSTVNTPVVLLIFILSACGFAGGSDSELRDLANKELATDNHSLSSPGGLCDKVENSQLNEVRIGTISTTDMTGTFAEPIPAIIARQDYVCVMSFSGKKEQQSQWIVVALDKEFNMARCLVINDKNVVEEAARSCGFAEKR